MLYFEIILGYVGLHMKTMKHILLKAKFCDVWDLLYV